MNGDRPVRLGVIGAGWFASRRHLPDIHTHADADLAALCRRDERQLARLAAQFEPERTFTDWRAMLDECPLDGVVIATPNSQHFEQAKAALERGIHVLLEKPMTIHYDDARALCELAGSRGLVLNVALNPPHWAHCHRIRGALHSGKLGDLESLSFWWTGNADVVFGRRPIPADFPGPVHPTMYRADPDMGGGGYLIDGGPHLISEALWVTGRRAVAVACLMDQTPMDNRAALSLMLEGGVTATINTIGDSRHKDRRLRASFGCANGSITVDGFAFHTTIQPEGGDPESFSEDDLPRLPSPVANFVEVIRGLARPLSPADHGAHVVQIVEAAYRSASEGSVVRLEP